MLLCRGLALGLLGALAACATGPAAAPPPTTATTGATGWQQLPDAPLSGRVDAVTAAVGDELVVVGGWEWLCPPTADCSFPGEPLLADGAALDTATGDWRPIAAAPFGLRGSPSAVLGEDVYVMTGCRAGPACDGRRELLGYDTRADRWQQLGLLPRAVRYAHLVPVGDELLALSDSDEHGDRADHLYDVATGTWRELPDDPLPPVYDRHAVVEDGRLLVFGSPRARVDEQDTKVGAALDLDTGRWTPLPDAPAYGYQVWRVGDEAWLNPHFGDGGGGVLDLATDTWRRFPDAPAGSDWGGDMAGVIGEGEATYEYAAGWVRDTRSDQWVRVPPRGHPAVDAESVTAVGDALVVFGGQRWGDAGGELLAEAWVWRPPR